MQIFMKLWEQYPGRFIGVMVGILLGIIFLIFGFWKTFIFSAFVGSGLYLGKKFDSREDIHDILEDILPENFFKS